MERRRLRLLDVIEGVEDHGVAHLKALVVDDISDDGSDDDILVDAVYIEDAEQDQKEDSVKEPKMGGGVAKPAQEPTKKERLIEGKA
jgi:hypothetical protein